ncbi:hypothetical protein E6O75_ATG03031 [Venturia nashicola]|uniref:Uncharacterized protein n=1 Tax=Venturia nashicola TaxID=86259 RepID=A0A4Z1P5L3_9PEZI|nr:hypothetical protein E6O75_ATG03031 [Venturia nashicola]
MYVKKKAHHKNPYSPILIYTHKKSRTSRAPHTHFHSQHSHDGAKSTNCNTGSLKHGIQVAEPVLVVEPVERAVLAPEEETPVDAMHTLATQLNLKIHENMDSRGWGKLTTRCRGTAVNDAGGDGNVHA